MIDAEARDGLQSHVAAMQHKGARVTQLTLPAECAQGTFVAPTIIEIGALSELGREQFGPILHVLRYRAADLDSLIDAINASGYGLTMGVHTRIDETVERVAARAHVGNLYVNRNVIGAVVGVQPFGGEGLSGTGPKAGGPLYLHRLLLNRDNGAGGRTFVDATVESGLFQIRGGPAIANGIVYVGAYGYSADGPYGKLPAYDDAIQARFGIASLMGQAAGDDVPRYPPTIIADKTVIPENHKPYYSEQVVYLPGSYLPNDSRRRIADRVPSRSEAGWGSTSLAALALGFAHGHADQEFERGFLAQLVIFHRLGVVLDDLVDDLLAWER